MDGTIITREQKQRKLIELPGLSVSKRFGKYKDEEEKVVRLPQQVTQDQTLKRLKEAWLKVRWRDEMGWDVKNQAECLAVIKGIQYTAKDIEKFSIAMAGFKGIKSELREAGLFLNTIIIKCKESDFFIRTYDLGPLDLLGWRNTKNITIDGDAGEFLGTEMSKGRIIVEGNTSYCSGQDMKGGEIIINGNCGHSLGHSASGGKITVKGNAGEVPGCQMSGGVIVIEGNCIEKLGFRMGGGKIIIKGNAGLDVGNNMWGGEIHLEGDFGSLDERIHNGKIYHKGKLIVDK